MENKITQKDINQIVWKACDTFRGVIDPSQYKDYILTMLFLKYVSDVHKDIYQKHLEKYKGDTERAARAMSLERFVVPNSSTFDYLFEHRNEGNLGEMIDIALADLEEANREKLSSEDGSGIFRNISFNSSNLGDAKDKNTRLKNLLIDFNALDLTPSHLEKGDIIGDAYEYLISNFASDAGKKAGEFYTPSEVSTLLAKLTKSKPGARISDPTCGSGSLLIKAGKEVGGDNFSLYGQEANGSTWALAVMNMFLHGFDNATIRWGDTIRNPKLKEGDALMKFDTVVANPPFSLDKWGADEAAADKYNRFWRGVPPKSKGDWAFISHMIETTYEGKGKVGVVVPHGVLFRGSSEGKIRQKTIEDNILEAIIGLPANLFFGTGIPAAILVFNKGKEKNNNVLFIDASQAYESGKNQNKLRDSDIDKIVDTYREFSKGKFEPGVVEEKYAYVATVGEIKENDFNLNIPRYVDTFEEEAEVDIAKVQKDIVKLEGELKTVQAEMDKYLKELGFKMENKLPEIEQLIRDGAKKAYHDNLFLTGNYSDFQVRIIESLVVITIAQKLLEWAFRNEYQIQLEYPIKDFYNGAFPNIIWTQREIFDPSKFIQRSNHNPKNNKSGRIDIAITKFPSMGKEGAYYGDPKLKSIAGIEIKSINSSKAEIENDFSRMLNAVALEDKISINGIQACYCLFFSRLDNPNKINSQAEIDKLKEKDLKHWQSRFDTLLLEKEGCQFQIESIIISEGAVDSLKGYYPPEEFSADEIAELTGLVMCYLIKIKRKELIVAND